jgi:hypothetical protein
VPEGNDAFRSGTSRCILIVEGFKPSLACVFIAGGGTFPGSARVLGRSQSGSINRALFGICVPELPQYSKESPPACLSYRSLVQFRPEAPKFLPNPLPNWQNSLLCLAQTAIFLVLIATPNN